MMFQGICLESVGAISCVESYKDVTEQFLQLLLCEVEYSRRAGAFASFMRANRSSILFKDKAG